MIQTGITLSLHPVHQMHLKWTDQTDNELAEAVTDGLKAIYQRLDTGVPPAKGDLAQTYELIQSVLAVLSDGPQAEPKRPAPIGNQARGGLAGWQLKAINALILQRLDTVILVVEMAAAVRLSPSHFSRAFRASLGMSPKQYLMHRRVEMAKEMLRDGSSRLIEVALSCGFCDQAHFTRVFHAATGVSPRRWRMERC